MIRTSVVAFGFSMLVGLASAYAAESNASDPAEQVRQALRSDPSFATVSVDQDNGIVVLSGQVGSASTANRAISVARCVPGVEQLQADFSIEEHTAER